MKLLTTIAWCLLAVFSWEAVRRYCAPDITIMSVADRQRFLNKMGFPCKVDGICGRETHKAQLDWEKSEINKDAIKWFKKFALGK